MKLYFYPPTSSLAPLIVAHELNLPMELVHVDLLTRTTGDGVPLHRISRKNLVPVLELDDGTILTETQVMLTYLTDLKPEVGLAGPTEGIERYRVLEWLSYFGSELHKLFTMLFWEIDAASKVEVTRRIIERFAIVEDALQRQSYLTGERYTVADIYALICIRGLHLVDFDLEAHYPCIARYRAELESRPAVKAAIAAHGAH